MRIGAIDIGSNAIRLLIVDVIQGEKTTEFRRTTLVRIPIRLGEDVYMAGKISDQKALRLKNAILGFSFLLKSTGTDLFRACATSAMREAENGEEIIATIKKESKIDIELIDGQEEAHLIFKNNLSSYLKKDKNYLYLDLGGGSTEITLLDHDQPILSQSFKVGTVRMMQKKVKASHWQDFKQCITEIGQQHPIEAIVGSGGNINKYYSIINDFNKRSNRLIKEEELYGFYKKLKKKSYLERILEYNLKPDRADVIIPAGKIFLSCCQWSGCEEILVPKIGLADGVVTELYQNSVS